MPIVTEPGMKTRYEKWTLLYHGQVGTKASFICKCDCGNVAEVPRWSLKSGRSSQCRRCVDKLLEAKRVRDVAGQKFGRLTAVSLAKVDRRALWNCICDCGKECVVALGSLTHGNTTSCGCAKLERVRKMKYKHGMASSPGYASWRAMLRRCYGEDSVEFPYYGGRGITICDRWRNSVETFLADMGQPESGMSIDRIDVNGDYTPENCRWATPKQQANNTRRNVFYTYEGRTQTLPQWASELEINSSTLYYRVVKHGWSLERAFTTPARPHTRQHKSTHHVIPVQSPEIDPT